MSRTLARIPIPASRPAFPCSYLLPTSSSRPNHAVFSRFCAAGCAYVVGLVHKHAFARVSFPWVTTHPQPSLGGGSLQGNRYLIPLRQSAASTSSRDHQGTRRRSDGGRARLTSLPMEAILSTRIATRRGTQDASGMSSHQRLRQRHRCRCVGGRSLGTHSCPRSRLQTSDGAASRDDAQTTSHNVHCRCKPCLRT